MMEVSKGHWYFVDEGSGSDMNDGLSQDKTFKTLDAAMAVVVLNLNSGCSGVEKHEVKGVAE